MRQSCHSFDRADDTINDERACRLPGDDYAELLVVLASATATAAAIFLVDPARVAVAAPITEVGLRRGHGRGSWSASW